jgi:transposase-like protein
MRLAAPGKHDRNGYRRVRLKRAEEAIAYSVPQIAECATLFRSPLRETLKGRTQDLRSLAIERYARGLSTRDIKAPFRDETGQALLGKSAVSSIAERLTSLSQDAQVQSLGSWGSLLRGLTAIHARRF